MLLFKVLIINFSILTSVAVSFTAFKSVAFKKWWAFIICSIFFSTQEQEYTHSLVHLEGVKLDLLIFPHSSCGKESTCNVGDPGLIPGSGRSPRAGIGHPLQYSWASLVAQAVKNPLAMQETGVQSLGWGDPPPMEEGLATHPSILAWRIPMDRGAWHAVVHGVAKSRT